MSDPMNARLNSLGRYASSFLGQPAIATELLCWLAASVVEQGPPVRPPTPTRDYCLLPPNVVRWDGEVKLEARLWRASTTWPRRLWP
jgi:hypothetical protein